MVNSKVFPLIVIIGALNFVVFSKNTGDLVKHDLNTRTTNMPDNHEHISSWNLNSPSIEFICGEKNRDGEVFNNTSIDGIPKSDYKIVSFKNCRFHEMVNNFFETFANLQTFNISGVDLESLEIKSFHGAKNLTNLLASNNRLTELPSHLFLYALQIEFVNFANNSIQHINPLAFDGVINLKTLNVSNNKIDKLDKLPLPTLMILDLSDNKLTTFDKRVFENLISLTHLYLSGNSIRKLEVQTFSRQKQLISLDLSKNNLVTFDFHVFCKQGLQTMFLRNALPEHGIQSLDDPYLHEHLKSLNLRENQLIEISNFRNENFSQLALLDINDNEFNCSYLQIFLGSVRWGIGLHTNDSWQNMIGSDNLHGVRCTAINQSIITSKSRIFSGSISRESIFVIEIALAFLCVCSTTVMIVIFYLGRNQLFTCCSNKYKFDVVENSKKKKVFPEFIPNMENDENKMSEIIPADN